MTPRLAVRPPAAPARAAALVIGLLLLVGCGSSTAPADGGSSSAPTSAGPATTTDGGTMTTGSPAPDDALRAGSVITQDDEGARVELAVGEEVSVQLAPPWDAAEPSSEDPAVVEVVRVDHFADPGYAEFSLLAHGPGETVVRVEGPDEEMVVNLTVTG